VGERGGRGIVSTMLRGLVLEDARYVPRPKASNGGGKTWSLPGACVDDGLVPIQCQR
jgi:hypothetical protein